MVYCIVAAIVLVIILLGIFIYYESKGFVTESYSFESDILDEDFEFVFFSDLHETVYGIDNDELICAIDKCGCRYILIGGDVITSKCDFSAEFEKTVDFIKRLGEKYTVVFSYGNHERALCDIRDCEAEYRTRAKDESDIKRIDILEKALSDSGAVILRNGFWDVPDKKVRLYGLDFSLKYFRRLVRHKPEMGLIDDILGCPDEEKYSILLAHDPEHFEEYSKWGCNLVLSGHLHGGIVRVPGLGGVISPQLRIFPKYDSGVFKLNGVDMLITRGIGTHTIPLRIFNKAEICKVTIKSIKRRIGNES